MGFAEADKMVKPKHSPNTKQKSSDRFRLLRILNDPLVEILLGPFVFLLWLPNWLIPEKFWRLRVAVNVAWRTFLALAGLGAGLFVFYNQVLLWGVER